MLNGIGQLNTPTYVELPAPPENASVNLADYLKFSTPVLALTSWNGANRMIQGFSDVEYDSQGVPCTCSASASGTGAPVPAVLLRKNGALIGAVEYSWSQIPGGGLLASQRASIYRTSGSLIEKATITLGYNHAQPASVPRDRRDRDRWLDGGVGQASCFGGVMMKTVGGVVALCASAYAVVTPPTAVGWIAEWLVWTGTLIDTAVACSGGGGQPLRKS